MAGPAACSVAKLQWPSLGSASSRDVPSPKSDISGRCGMNFRQAPGGARRHGRRQTPAIAMATTPFPSKSPMGPVDSMNLEHYTPYNFVSYSTTKSEAAASVTVNAPADKCFNAWYDRNNHFKFLSLAEHIGYDAEDSKDAMYMLFYRYAKLPALQLLTEIERTEVVPGELIRFQHTADKIEEEPMLPIGGEVKFAAAATGTEVSVSISYGIPNLLVDEVGAKAVELNVQEILKDNMARFKALVEGS